MPQSDYPSGTIVYAKLKGYPWWPGEVIDDESVPERVLKSKPKSKGSNWTVFFFGKTREYGFFTPEFIKPFVRSEAESELAQKKFKTKELELAVRQALNPSLLDAMDHDNDVADENEGGEEDEQGSPMNEDAENEEDDGDDVPKKRKKSGDSKKNSSSKSSTANSKVSQRNGKTPGSSKLKKKKNVDEEEDFAVEEDEAPKSEKKSHKKRLSKDDDDESRSKRRKSTSEEKLDSGSSRKPPGSPVKEKGPSSTDTRDDLSNKHKAKKVDDKDPPPDEQHRQLKELRHTLQRMVYNVAEVTSDQYRKIDKALSDVEKFEMNYSLLQWTKIGKVIKSAHKHDYPNDPYHIKQRVEKLLAAWKELLEVDHGQGSENGGRSVAEEKKDGNNQEKVGESKQDPDDKEPELVEGMELDSAPNVAVSSSTDVPAEPSSTSTAVPSESAPAPEPTAEENPSIKTDLVSNEAIKGKNEDVDMGGFEDANTSKAG